MSDEQQWSYFPWVTATPNVSSFADGMNLLGEDGWELVTSVSTVKTWLNLTGNNMVFVFKKPGVGHRLSADQVNRLAGLDPNVAY